MARVPGFDPRTGAYVDCRAARGTTYDVWDFPGAFVYSATLYLATLRTMGVLAAAIEPSRAAGYEARYAACARRLDEDLWDPRGFFRSSETRDTIFTAALAGDWAVRWLGLEPIVDPMRAASHLRHQHRVLVLPWLLGDAGPRPGTCDQSRGGARIRRAGRGRTRRADRRGADRRGRDAPRARSAARPADLNAPPLHPVPPAC
jgi:hypothetical protein